MQSGEQQTAQTIGGTITHGEAYETVALTEEERGLLKSYFLYNPCGLPALRVATFVDDTELLREHGGIGNGIVR